MKATVVGPQALLDAINERQAVRLAARRALSHASKLNAKDYGSIKQLRDLLGLPPLYTTHEVHSASDTPEDALIVSFDTEWERHGLREHIVEIGVTILDTRDIINVPPGPYAHEWISKAKTYHYVVDVTRRPTDRMRACYFSDDMFGDIHTIKRDLVSILQQAAHPRYNPSKARGLGPRKVILVGHSVSIDLNQLFRSPGLKLDLFSKDVFITKPDMAFDTLMLTDAAIQQGADIRSARLGKLVNWLGVHPQYRHNDTIIGVHNAGNDAAYTLMALLMYAVRWEQIVPGEIVPASAEELTKQRELRAKKYENTMEDRATQILGKRLMRKARALSKETTISERNKGLQTVSPEDLFWHFWLRKLQWWLRRP